jgi:hypothetical protein
MSGISGYRVKEFRQHQYSNYVLAKIAEKLEDANDFHYILQEQ